MILEGLETDRLIFRSLDKNDVDLLLPFFEDPKAMEFRTPATPPVKDHILKTIERQQQRYASDGYGLAALISKETGEFIGQCGLLAQEVDDTEELEIGYHLMPAHWGSPFYYLYHRPEKY